MTYREAVCRGESLLKEKGIADAGCDAWLLLSMVCGIDRNFYYMHMNDAMAAGHQLEYEKVLNIRAGHMPLQYITGEQEFMGLRFLVDRDVLIPRWDTEILVEEALKRIKPQMEVLDLCTGSGCIIISILKKEPSILATASDVSGQALRIAQKNAALNGVSVNLIESDLFCNIARKFDMIVSNPPYIKTEEIEKLMPEVREYEPRKALDGSADGLFFYRNIILEGKRFLKPAGYLVFEIGSDQGEEVCALMREAGYNKIEIVKDLAGHNRVVIGGNHV